MFSNSNMFSIRIVTVDYYIQKPIPELDLCYSQFRAKEIKQVPVIRIFGANLNGVKTSMNIHGVYPYFYIPYESKDLGGIETFSYQLAVSLDKAINITLGQATSNQQHVFKIQPVKGIPFYGYHKGEHQYLKIYMYNPRFIKRAANLLQNGAISNKNFQPHESHVPFILQFLIDYNLYGMDFLHISESNIRYRKTSLDEDLFCSVPLKQIIAINKNTISKIEVDINANCILNRFDLENKNSLNTNPGIEAIWRDEKCRRSKLLELNSNIELSSLKPPEFEDRPNAKVTDSEIFYYSALKKKVENVKELNLSNNTLSFESNTTLSSQHQTIKSNSSEFGLSKFLINAVYPEECYQNSDNLLNASIIENHSSKRNVIYRNDCEKDLFDESNSDLLLSLSQSNDQSLIHDNEVLEIMRQLEEEDEQNINKNMCIDLDSTLAPLSQEGNSKLSGSNKLTENEIISSDSENEDINDLTILNEDIDEFLLKLSQPNPIILPQLDGGNDNYKTPKKNYKTNEGRSPKSKSRLSRYKPLEIVTKSPVKRSTPNLNGSLRNNLEVLNIELVSNSTESYQNKDLAIAEKMDLVKEDDVISISSSDSNIIEKCKVVKNSLNKTKTTITCNLKTPKSRSKRLRTEKITSKNDSNLNGNNLEISNQNNTPEIKNFNRQIIPTKYDFLIKNCKVQLKKISLDCKESSSVHNYDNLSSNFIIQNDGNNSSKQNIAQTFEKLISNKLNSPRKKIKIQENKSIFKLDNNSNQINNRPKRSCSNITLKRLPSFTEKKLQIKSSFVQKQVKVLVKNLKKKELLKLIKDNISKDPFDKRRRSWSPSDVAREHDRRYNFFPEPGPSHINYYSLIKLPSSNLTLSTKAETEKLENSNQIEISSHSNITTLGISPSTPSSDRLEDNYKLQKNVYEPVETLNSPIYNSPNKTQSLNLVQKVFANKFEESYPVSPQSDDNLNVISFYDKTIICNDSPSLFSDFESPVVNTLPLTDRRTLRNTNTVIIRPKEYPPNYQDVFENMRKFQIPMCKHLEPFYGNSADKTNLKEVGANILSISGNKLNDLEEYKSIVPNLMGLNSVRKKILEAITGNNFAKQFKTSNQIKEYLCSEKRIFISTQQLPPNRKHAQLWLRARKLNAKNKNDLKPLQNDDDSPIKIRRQKVVIMMENDDDDSCNAPLKSILVSPIRPLSDDEMEVPAGNAISCTPQLTKYRSINKSKLFFNERLNLLENTSSETLYKYKNIELDGTQNIDNNTNAKIEESFHGISENSSESFKTISQQSNGTAKTITQDVENELLRTSFKRDLEKSKNNCSFGLSGPSLNNTYGFKVNLENLQNAKSDIEHTFLTIMSMEIFVSTRKNFMPNPEIDEIKCIFYTIVNNVSEISKIPVKMTGYIICDAKHKKCSKYTNLKGQIDLVQNEEELINKLLDICIDYDPDILVGYEIERNSWGYILERGKYLNMNLNQTLSRVPNQKVKQSSSNDEDYNTDSYMDLDIETKLCGRILLDVWRLMRSEIALTSYSFENIMYHILHRRCPLHSLEQLTEWYESDITKWIVFEYYMERVNGTLELLDQLDLIGRTSEMAKLIGIQFYEVLSRGSQFRVESMMLRMAKPKNIIPLSPSIQQRAHMRAPEYLPLILEPQSRFYSDPLIVLDFQSLYPSVMIAYNYCFSTCLGRVEHLGQSSPFEFGASQLKISTTLLQKMIKEDKITISPCGAVFAKSNVREGILPRMLREILDTRLMVKQSMKIHKNNSTLQRVLHSRQLGLKLVANVTYGYTAANFSGRMPCVEVGDSVVAKGRECLERAIKLVESNEKWNVKVVYGDTDSLFVLCPGQSREDSFKIGTEIADAVTKDNPYPIKLKLEKVYQPSILQTKKRYVGYMYENSDQKDPIFEAKGIETVRRDGCPAVAKMLEKCLRILFETRNISKIKEYVCRQFTKILQGKANIQDLIFAKEFRGRSGYKPGACVPALELTKKWMQLDPRKEPRSGERVPYLIINGPPGVPLIRLVCSPYEYLSNPGLKINSIYYITKAIIPPLNRCLLLIGVDVNEWFAELPRKALSIHLNLKDNIKSKKNEKKNTISQYFSSINCVCDCGNQTSTNNSICESCRVHTMKSVVILQNKISKLDRSYSLVEKICQSCCERFEYINCSSLDCPVLYVKEIKYREFKQIQYLKQIVNDNFIS